MRAAGLAGRLRVQRGGTKGGGGRRAVQFAKRQLIVNPYESTAVADLNKDGHLDIVYGAYWFAGPDFVPRTFRPNHLAAEYIRANSDHVYDVDGDGWPDIIAGGWNEDGIYWYKNPGNSAKEKGAPWESTSPGRRSLLAKTRGNMEMFAAARLRRRRQARAVLGQLPQAVPAGGLALRQGRGRPAQPDAVRAGRRGRRARLRLRRRQRRRPRGRADRGRLVRAAGGRHLGRALEAPPGDRLAPPELPVRGART